MGKCVSYFFHCYSYMVNKEPIGQEKHILAKSLGVHWQGRHGDRSLRQLVTLLFRPEAERGMLGLYSLSPLYADPSS